MRCSIIGTCFTLTWLIAILIALFIFGTYNYSYPWSNTDKPSLSSEKRLGIVGCANVVQWQIEKPSIEPYVAKATEDGKITNREYLEISEKYFDAVHAEYIEKLRIE